MLPALLDLIFPPRCTGCNAPGGWFCAACQTRVRDQYAATTHCAVCDRDSTRSPCANCRHEPLALAGVIVTGEYVQPLKDAIWSLKFKAHPQAARPLGQMLATIWQDRGHGTLDALIPVPMSAQHRRERGYNQAELLAQSCGKVLQVPVVSDVVCRTRTAPTQRGLDRAARRANVVGLFSTIRPMTGQRVAIVDDVMTTGATLSAMAETLYAQGAAAVFGLVLAGTHSSDAHI